MATHSSVLAWRIPGTGEPGGLPSMGLHRVRHDWSDLAAAAALIVCERQDVANIEKVHIAGKQRFQVKKYRRHGLKMGGFYAYSTKFWTVSLIQPENKVLSPLAYLFWVRLVFVVIIHEPRTTLEKSHQKPGFTWLWCNQHQINARVRAVMFQYIQALKIHGLVSNSNTAIFFFF